ncbi:MAG: hypothetical protein FK732_10830 [Asgard group archaeon]|nr:hypothetical protein [Asgard group archaeon]
MDESEYPDTLTLYDVTGEFVMDLSWGHNNSHLAIGMSISGNGWLGLGFGEAGVTMSGADIIMANIKSDLVTIEDMYSVKQGQPKEDADSYISTEKSIGLNNVNGTESDDKSTIEFIIPLSSNDTEGYDHDWEVGKTYGFYSAYRLKGDSFINEHTSHSESLVVTILDQTAASPSRLTHSFEITDRTSTLILKSTISGLSNVTGFNVGFYKKSLFGRILLGTVETDETGLAQIEVEIDKFGEVIYLAIIPASIEVSRSETSDMIEILGTQESSVEEFGDIRDTFNDEHLMRSFLLFGFFTVIASLIMVYAGVFLDLFKIFRLGQKEMEKSNVKEEITE